MFRRRVARPASRHAGPCGQATTPLARRVRPCARLILRPTTATTLVRVVIELPCFRGRSCRVARLGGRATSCTRCVVWRAFPGSPGRGPIPVRGPVRFTGHPRTPRSSPDPRRREQRRGVHASICGAVRTFDEVTPALVANLKHRCPSPEVVAAGHAIACHDPVTTSETMRAPPSAGAARGQPL